MIKAASVWLAEQIGLKKRDYREKNEPRWKRRIEGDIKKLRQDVNLQPRPQSNFKKIVFRLPLTTKRCAGDEVGKLVDKRLERGIAIEEETKNEKTIRKILIQKKRIKNCD